MKVTTPTTPPKRVNLVMDPDEDGLFVGQKIEEKPSKTSGGGVGMVIKTTTCYVWFETEDGDTVQKRRCNVREYDEFRYDPLQDMEVGCTVEVHRGVHWGKIQKVVKKSETYLFLEDCGRCGIHNARELHPSPKKAREDHIYLQRMIAWRNGGYVPTESPSYQDRHGRQPRRKRRVRPVSPN